jgi:hypothetical protein
MSATDVSDRRREDKLRRMAKQQGLALRKSRQRNPQAIDYGGWMIVDPFTNTVVAGTESIGRPHWSLDDVEGYLNREGE